MRMRDITNEYRKRIQEATCIEEEMVVWYDIFYTMDERDRTSYGACTNLYTSYFVDPIQVAYVTHDRIPFKNITEDEKINLPLSNVKKRDMSEEEQYDIIKRCANMIRLIDNPSERIQIEACRYDGSLLKYIKNPCEQAKLLASRNTYNLKFIENPTEEMYAMAFYDMQHNTIYGKKVDTNTFALMRLVNKIPQQIYKERVIDKDAEKKLMKWAEKNIYPIIIKHGVNIQKAYDSQSELKIHLAEASMLWTALKMGRKFLISWPLQMFLIIPKAMIKYIILTFYKLYLEEIYGIKEEMYEKYESYSGKFTYGNIVATMVEMGL